MTARITWTLYGLGVETSITLKNNVENSDSEKKEGLFGVLFTHTMAKFMPAVIPTSISIFSHPIAYGSAVKDALAQYWWTPAEIIIRLGGSHVKQWKTQTPNV